MQLFESTRGGRSTTVLAGGIFIISAAAIAGATPPTFELTLLETNVDDHLSFATAITEAGDLAGYARPSGGRYHGWVNLDGGYIDLGHFGGTAFRVWNLAETGHAVGHANIEGDPHWMAFRWHDGEFDMIPTHGGPSGVAYGVNDVGQVVGHSQIPLPEGHYQAYLWDEGALTNLGTLGGGNSAAFAINNSGEIAGSATNAQISARAVVWIDGIVHELEHPPGEPSSVAYDINDAGVCVGATGESEWDDKPAMWIDHALIPLPWLPGAWGSVVFRVNEHGDAVGWTNRGDFDTVATLWWRGEVHDLNDLVDLPEDVYLYKALDINDERSIVGIASVDGPARAMLLTPISIPGDIDDDWDVDTSDLLLLLAAWGDCPVGELCPADVNGDAIVDAVDLLKLLAVWG
jgi:probable HAF family extracellular repeat protein